MKKDILVVVDMQNDFVSDALGTAEAQSIVPAVTARVAEGIQRGEEIIFTRDTHEADYLQTREGRHLPVSHCIRGTQGWEIISQLREYTADCTVLDKPTFGSTVLMERLAERDAVGKITLIGLCTDICVISNAMLLKAALPEADICVEAACCAGVTPESHRNALQAMAMCQITVIE